MSWKSDLNLSVVQQGINMQGVIHEFSILLRNITSPKMATVSYIVIVNYISVQVSRDEQNDEVNLRPQFIFWTAIFSSNYLKNLI